MIEFQNQQQVWADELRKADQRAIMYKNQLDQFELFKSETERRMKEFA